MKHFYVLLMAIVTGAMVSAQTGNTGIGTTTPGSKLTVNGSFAAAYKSVTTSTYTAGEDDFYVVWNGTGAGTITLPASASGADRTGRLYYFKNTSSVYTLTIDAAGTELIDDAQTILLQPGETALLVKTNVNTVSGTTYEIIQVTKSQHGYVYAVSSATSENHNQGAVVKSNFTQVDFSPNGGADFNLATDEWTCPQSGYYRIEAFETGSHPAGTVGQSHRGMFIFKNGAGTAGQNQYYTLVNALISSGYNSSVIYLTQGEVVDVRLQMCLNCGPTQMRSVFRRLVITRL